MKQQVYQFGAMVLMGMMAVGCTDENPNVVTVEGGKVQGYESNGLTIYKGIPFAAPPVGDLRWKAPQPVNPWDTVLVADHYATGPIQGAPSPEHSEDCLYLNIWTPTVKSAEKLPVLVWIYGGGFVFGDTADPSYDCEALAMKANGSVILASINYRVGPLGFMTLPELSQESESGASGNYGLMDQMAGLRWIQNNIEKFGGDPGRVTIFGESAGGISVSMLCASPLAKGLFAGAISQSGGSFGPVDPRSYPGENMQALATAEQDGVKMMEALGASSLAELRAMDASAFAARGLGACSWPVVDGYVITDDQYKLYEKGEYNDVNVLIGYNSDEGASFSFGVKDKASHEASVKARYGEYADALLEAYPYTDEDGGKQGRDLMRDAAFGWQTWAWARLQAKTGKGKVYLYYFDEHPEHPQGSENFGKGSYHGQEVSFVFQHRDNFERPEVDNALSDIMGEYWLNFAKSGDPNGEGLPVWPVFNNDEPQTMYLTGPEPFAGPVPSEKAMWVLEEYFKGKR